MESAREHRGLHLGISSVREPWVHRALIRCPLRHSGTASFDMEQQLKELLARALCALVEGWTQDDAAAVMRLHQSQLSRLRNGKLEGFSAARLIRLIGERGYNVEIHLKPIPRRFAQPRQKPNVTLVRYDRYGRVAD